MQGKIDAYSQEEEIVQLENTAGPPLEVSHQGGARLHIHGVWAEFLLRLAYRINSVSPQISKALIEHFRNNRPFTGWTVSDNVNQQDKIHQFVMGRGENKPGHMMLMSATLNIPNPFVELGYSNPDQGLERPSLYLIKDRLIILPIITIHMGNNPTGTQGTIREVSERILQQLENHPSIYIPDSPVDPTRLTHLRSRKARTLPK